MSNKTWGEIRDEVKNAWEMANKGYKAEPRGGMAGKILGPKYSSLDNEAPSQTSSSNQSFSILEGRLRQLYQLYEKGQIDYQDFEREKARILSEI